MSLTPNDIMGMLEEAEELGYLKIEQPDELEKWLHDEQGYLYLEEQR